MPLTKFNEYAFLNHGWDGTEGWSTNVLERFGFPIYFSERDGGAAFLAEDADKKFSDDEILNLLKGTLVLSSNTAKNLIKRGFGAYLGIDIRDWKGKTPTIEMFDDKGAMCTVQVGTKELVIVDDDVKIYSKVCHSLDNTNFTYLFPGTTFYKNKLGGNVIVFCGTPVTTFHYATAFSFLNQSRKKQMAKILKETGNLPLYYDSDEEVYLKCAKYDGDKLFVAMFSMGFDIIEEINLKTEKDVKKVKMLTCDGTYKECEFEKRDGGIIVKEIMYTLNPVILILE